MILNIYIYLIINVLNKFLNSLLQLSYSQGDRFQKLIQIFTQEEGWKSGYGLNKKGPPSGEPFPILVGKLN